MTEPCVECSRTGQIHAARGRCITCYKREWRSDEANLQRDREHSRRWKHANKVACRDCGGPVSVAKGFAKAGERCSACSTRRLQEERAARTRQTIAEIIELRGEGLSNVEIAGQLGYHKQHVANLFSRAKREGFDVPRSPYFRDVA